MRVLLGADAEQAATMPALQLLRRLRFNAARIEAVRVVPPPVVPILGPDGTFGPELLSALMQAEEGRAQTVVKGLAQELGEAGHGATVLYGGVTGQLLHHADETGADLIAVNGHEGSPALAGLIGSVARGLVLGARQSVLLARPSDATPDRPVRAVLATDHSEYADRCWGQLTRFWPRGISHLTVLTAYPEDRLKALEPLLPSMGISPTQAIRDQLTTRNEALALQLSNCFHPACTRIDTVVSSLPVHEAIAAQMKASDADLLILGARGHGLLERLTLGSVALREAMTCPKAVLVLRA